VVGHGAVRAVIQGSRPDAYVVTIEAAEGTGVPSKREVWISCTCPDDGVETEACKHAVAALFALSDEVAIEPELIERWRTGSARRRPATSGLAPSDLATVVPLRRDQPAAAHDRPPEPPPRDPIAEELAMLLGAPNAAPPPEFPAVTAFEHTGIRDRQLADVLDDAIAHLAIDWG